MIIEGFSIGFVFLVLLFVYFFIVVLLPGLFYGIIALFIFAFLVAYTFYKCFLAAPFRAIQLWREGKLETSYTRSKRLWYASKSMREWIFLCIKSDVAAIKLIINL
jgi:hypothetical protein